MVRNGRDPININHSSLALLGTNRLTEQLSRCRNPQLIEARLARTAISHTQTGQNWDTTSSGSIRAEFEGNRLYVRPCILICMVDSSNFSAIEASKRFKMCRACT
ncbi:uncharacterized protein RSE6_12905 [Rhynchosporium secalis]|uniref:Uncharacterized protein n=1 Tax=Rhynchosporium secalis TaxID=38038 RepID=A0A1E1MRM8_RHYSE|nr:uncharacterized protein RSE6_12905 [Rhynchosporium secalis]